MRRIALIGFMGSGKSTVGPLVAEALGRTFVDLDAVVTEETGRTVAEIFAAEGEDGWRRREHRALLDATERKDLVLGCGGGVVTGLENRDVLRKEFLTLYLSATPESLLERLRGSKGRPLLDVGDPEAALRELYEKRLPLYEEAADIIINTDGREPRELSREIAEKVKRES